MRMGVKAVCDEENDPDTDGDQNDLWNRFPDSATPLHLGHQIAQGNVNETC